MPRIQTQTNFRSGAASAGAVGAKGSTGQVAALSASAAAALIGSQRITGTLTQPSRAAGLAVTGKRRIIGALAAASRPATLAVTGVSAGFSQAEMDADFAARASAVGNIWANNFTDIYEAGVINPARAIGSTADIEDDSDAMGVGPGQDIVRVSTPKLSGEASVDAQTFDTTQAGDGSYNARMNGQDDTEIDRAYVQFSVYYPRATIAWRYPILGSTAFKIANFGNFGGGQFVLAIDRFMGFPAGFINGSLNLSQAVGSTFSSTPWGNVIHIQNAIDTGTPATPTTKAQWLQRYGYLLGGLEDDMQWGYNEGGSHYLDERAHAGFGWPDSRAASAGKSIVIDGWTTFEVFIDRANDTLQIWMAEYGDAPTLIWEGIGNVPFNAGSDVSELYLLNYDTQRDDEPGLRPTPQHTYFAELVVSQSPIRFPNPGGTPHALPGNLGGPTALSQAFAALEVGEDADYPGGAMANALAAIPNFSQGICDWNALFHHDSAHAELQGFGKVAVSQGRHYRHYMFDEATEAWRNVAGDDFIASLLPNGHPYYEHTLDTTTGDFYWRDWNGQRMQRYTRANDDWDYVLDDVDGDGTTWINSNPGAIAFHPDLYPAKPDPRGIVIWGRGRIHTISLQTEQDDELAVLGAHDDPGPCVYCPGLDAVITGGAGGDLRAYRVNPGNPPTYVQIADFPGNGVGGSGHASVLLAHPVTGMPMVLEREFDDADAARVWLYNGTTWALQAYTHPFAALVAANSGSNEKKQWIACSMPTYGGIGCLWMKATGANDYDLGFHCWKPP